MAKIDEDDITPYEYKLTDSEIGFWNEIAKNEAVHNVMGEYLSNYKEAIWDQRNRFVDAITKKYKIKQARTVTIDPVTKKIVSVYNPTQQARIVSVKEQSFKKPSYQKMQLLVKELQDLFIDVYQDKEERHGYEKRN